MSLVASALHQPLVDVKDAFGNDVGRAGQIGSRDIIRKVRMPRHQATPRVYDKVVRTIDCDTITTSLFSSTSMQKYVIRAGDIEQIRDLNAELVLAIATAEAQLVPTPLMFPRIDFRATGNNQLLATMFADPSLHNQITLCTKGRQRALFGTLNIGASPENYLGATKPLGIGNHKMILPLAAGGLFAHMDAYLKKAKSDLVIEFTPASTIKASGSGTVSLVSMKLIIDTAKLSAKDVSDYERETETVSREQFFLDPVISDFSTYSVTAGATHKFNLKDVKGWCTHQLVTVRSQGASNTNNGLMKLWNIGVENGAAIDLLKGNESVLGGGSAISAFYNQFHAPLHDQDNDVLCEKNFIRIPYCDNVGAAINGDVDGAHFFSGNNEYLALSFGAAPVAEVHTFTSAGLLTGRFRLKFRDSVSPELAYNANAAAIQSAFAALPSAARQNITVALSDDLTATSSVWTFTHPETNGLEGDMVEILGNGTVAVAAVRTTPGTSGCPSGTYDIQIYSYMLKRATYIDGKLKTEDAQ